MGAIKGIILKFGPADNTQLYSCDTRCHYIIQTTEHLLSCYAWRCACLVSSPSFLSTSTWFTSYCTFPAFFCFDTDLLTPATYHLPSLRTKQCILIKLMSETSYFFVYYVMSPFSFSHTYQRKYQHLRFKEQHRISIIILIIMNKFIFLKITAFHLENNKPIKYILINEPYAKKLTSGCWQVLQGKSFKFFGHS